MIPGGGIGGIQILSMFPTLGRERLFVQLFLQVSTSLTKGIHRITDLKDTKGKFDKDDPIHMFDMVFGVGHNFIIKDSKSMFTVGRQSREADFMKKIPSFN